MERLLSPKQVARAIAVSESSVKRWCDQGLIDTARTAGKHRRIPLDAVVRFLRATQRPLARPEELGLSAGSLRKDAAPAQARDLLRDALLAGDEATSRRLLIELALQERAVAAICDDVLAPVLFEIGERWGCGDLEVYEERRSCEICVRNLLELRLTLPAATEESPVAAGGTLEADHYKIPTLMAELVLREAGWRAVSLGTGLPGATLQAAVETLRPRLFWISVSHVEDESRLANDLRMIRAACGAETELVIGGQALTERLRRKLPEIRYCANMRELASMAAGLWTPPPRPAAEESSDGATAEGPNSP